MNLSPLQKPLNFNHGLTPNSTKNPPKVIKALGFKSIEDSLPKNIDPSKGRFEKLSDFANLSPKEQAKVFDRFNSPLSGYANGDEAKVSIWGKILGYDDNFGKTQIDELKDFINESGILGVGFNGTLFQGTEKPFSVDELEDKFKPGSTSILLHNEPLVELLDSDLSIDEFKTQWAKHTLKERFNLTISDDDAKNSINILNQLIEEQKNKPQEEKNKDNKFKPIQAFSKNTTYEDDSTREIRKIYQIVKREFDLGKNTFDILKKVAQSRVNKLI
ncbi:hypothetical protein [Campylobacter pinnipediorum]|uniref:hypothetical protein n=1 Tax=Campylobacter pinnipediorum TaxID=1965231 RepID=UPI00084DE982|nr:hypothetical protein [Campylobacter pinnipediorum]AQW82819.1 hypothetical protein CPIN17261_0808 [Campylobacter pinnipediorum subsp. pinnipediorum]